MYCSVYNINFWKDITQIHNSIMKPNMTSGTTLFVQKFDDEFLKN
jgi:hypothetical protein